MLHQLGSPLAGSFLFIKFGCQYIFKFINVINSFSESVSESVSESMSESVSESMSSSSIRLPNTGEEDSRIVSLVGLGLLSTAFLAGRKKRRKDEELLD